MIDPESVDVTRGTLVCLLAVIPLWVIIVAAVVFFPVAALLILGLATIYAVSRWGGES